MFVLEKLTKGIRSVLSLPLSHATRAPITIQQPEAQTIADEFQPQRFQPTSYLSHHLSQSCYDGYSPQIELPFERERVFFTDGGHISLDWLGKSAHENTNKPIIFVMHGVTGGSQTKYIRAIAQKAQVEGYICVCMNSRGINSEMTSPIPYVGTEFHELQEGIKRVRVHFPHSDMHLVGTSLGGNHVLRYVIEKKKESEFKSLSLISAPFDLLSVIKHMNPIYHRALIRYYIHETVTKHEAMKFWWESKIVDLEHLKESETLRDFHQRITTHITGEHDVDTLIGRLTVPLKGIEELRLKTFILTSEDDPVVNFSTIPTETILGNKNITFMATKKGAHLCWFEGNRNPQRWYPKPLLQFINKIQRQEQGKGQHKFEEQPKQGRCQNI